MIRLALYGSIRVTQQQYQLWGCLKFANILTHLGISLQISNGASVDGQICLPRSIQALRRQAQSAPPLWPRRRCSVLGVLEGGAALCVFFFPCISCRDHGGFWWGGTKLTVLCMFFESLVLVILMKLMQDVCVRVFAFSCYLVISTNRDPAHCCVCFVSPR